MIDFNDTPISSDVDRQAQRDQIRSDLTSRLESVPFPMFPAGKTRRGQVLSGGGPGSHCLFDTSDRVGEMSSCVIRRS